MFKQIPNYPNYAINYEGHVFSEKTGSCFKYPYPLNTKGYPTLNLRQNGKRKTITVHKLMGITFLPNFYNKPQLDHKNRDRTDNRLWNLRWVTRSENQQNKGMNKNNKLKEKNICKHLKGGYDFTKKINKKVFRKYFKTLDEAIDYRDNKLYLLSQD